MKRMSGRSSVTPDSIVRVLFDGWALASDPGSPEALHTIELIQVAPPGFAPLLALPHPVELPFNFPAHQRMVPNKNRHSGGRLRWEQATFPGLARQCAAQILHLTTPYPPLASPVPCLLSPAAVFPSPREPGSQIDRSPGFWGRARASFGQGGLSGLAGLLWPEDLPAPEGNFPVFRLPPYTHPAFDLQETGSGESADYVLAPGPLEPAALEQLAAAWTWVTGGLGEDWKLRVSGLSPDQRELFQGLCASRGITAELVDFATVDQRAAAFHQAAILLVLTETLPWGDPLLQGLSAGIPIAGWETSLTGERVGRAGYLVKHGDTRALGAAVVTLLVEKPVADSLRRAARERASQMGSALFQSRLGEIYRAVIHAG